MKLIRNLQLLIFVFLISGCATKLVEQVQSDERKAANLQNGIERSRSSLSIDGEVYENGACSLPPRSKEPLVLCENDSRSEEVGMAACVASYGCTASILAFKEGLTTFQEKWMASEACTAASRELKNTGYRLDQSLYNLTAAVVDSGCERESQGFWGTLLKGASCATAYSMAVERGLAFSNCISREANKCENATRKWKQEPFDRLERCEKKVAQIESKETERSSLQADIQKRKDTLTWKLFGK